MILLQGASVSHQEPRSWRPQFFNTWARLRKLSTTQRKSLRSTVQSIYKYLIWVVALLMGVVAPLMVVVALLIGVVVLLMGVVALLMGVSLSAVMC